MVMIIDDDKDDCEIFRDAAMQVCDCVCHCQTNPVEALSVLQRSSKLPNVIFLDINMPVMNGFQVLTKLKNNPKLSSIPVVVYSTTPNPREAEKSIQLGAKKFIRKTADYKKLVRYLDEVKRDLDVP